MPEPTPDPALDLECALECAIDTIAHLTLAHGPRCLCEGCGRLPGLRAALDRWRAAPAVSPAAALGARGGEGRARSLTPERRSEIARDAVRARWAKRRKAGPAGGEGM